MKRALILGGASGIGLSIATELANKETCEHIYIFDKNTIAKEFHHPKFRYVKFDLSVDDFAMFDRFNDIDTLIITAGFGRLSLFEDIDESHIVDSFSVNSIGPIRVIHHFMNKLLSPADFYCGIMVSIAGFMSSPFFAVYGATKAALKIFIESVNVELEKSGSFNRILNISPGSIKGTGFSNGKTDLSLTKDLADDIIYHLSVKDDLFIPQYEETFREVLDRYHKDFREEGRHSYDYKINSGRVTGKEDRI